MGNEQPQMSSSIEELTSRLLELVAVARVREEELTAFAGVRANQKHGAFTVVGQAPLGWTHPFTPSDLETADARRRVIADLREKNHKPKELKTPFWVNARAVATALGEIDSGEAPWESQISWTNLYRVSKHRGNPSPQLRAMQAALCTQILWREFLLWRPRRILFMTGLPWAAPFILSHQLANLDRCSGGRFVKAVGGIELRNGRQPAIVVVEHPARKNGSAEDRATEIAEAFRDLDRQMVSGG